MKNYGFLRVAGVVPRVRVADVRANVAAIAELVRQVDGEGADVTVFPELCLTGYTCADLFFQQTLLREAVDGLLRLADRTSDQQCLTFVGLPLAVNGPLYNVAAVLQGGRILGLVPKQYLPNYQEFYERRWFTPARGAAHEVGPVRLGSVDVPFGTDLLFAASNEPGVVVGVEICEDLWAVVPPSSLQALAGATLLCNLSASNELIAKEEYRRQLVVGQSARCVAGYVYVGAGPTESTTDLVFGGETLFAENGRLLARGPRFQRDAVVRLCDFDLDAVMLDRRRLTPFADAQAASPRRYRRVEFKLKEDVRTTRSLRAAHTPVEPITGDSHAEIKLEHALVPGEAPPKPRRRFLDELRRPVSGHPFVPADPARLAVRCEEIFSIQTCGLAKRLEAAKVQRAVIGISGGLDSTLALLAAVQTFDMLGLPRTGIVGITMPGFGTTDHTRSNADRLMALLGITALTLDIRTLSHDVLKALAHPPFGIDATRLSLDALIHALAQIRDEHRHDLVFENVQARLRTLLLMCKGFVIGTGDLSELALGWCTYNADHLSMYNPNVSIPKTLVRFLVRWVADHKFEGDVRRVLHSIAESLITPELLPLGASGQAQSTEATVGPYELHDFFLYHMLRFGYGPRKILLLARHATFERRYPEPEVALWLRDFYRRFFHSQYKRSCLPDGPKVGSISLSPRGDWRMPSDAEAESWLAELADAQRSLATETL